MDVFGIDANGNGRGGSGALTVALEDFGKGRGLAGSDSLFHPFGSLVAVFVPPPGLFLFGLELGNWFLDHVALRLR